MKKIIVIMFLTAFFTYPAQAQLLQVNNTPNPQVEADQQAQRINNTFQFWVMAYRREFDAFWRNPKATPAQMAEAHGVRCLKIFQNSMLTRNFINSVDPNILPPEYQSPLSEYTVEMQNGQPTGRIIIGE